MIDDKSHSQQRQRGVQGTALAWSGLAAGLSMGFSLVAEGLLAAGLQDAHMGSLVVFSLERPARIQSGVS